MVLSIADYERLTRARPDFWRALQAFRKSHDLAGLDVDATFEGAGAYHLVFDSTNDESDCEITGAVTVTVKP